MNVRFDFEGVLSYSFYDRLKSVKKLIRMERRGIMSEVYYSVSSHRKIVHMSSCSVLKRIEKERIRTFDNMEEAWLKGYHLCRCCSPLMKKYRREKNDIEQWCFENGFYTYLKSEKLFIGSHLHAWCICSDRNGQETEFYHQNWFEKKNFDDCFLLGYHKQNYKSFTLVGYLKYIKNHDTYMLNEKSIKQMPPKKEKNNVPKNDSPCIKPESHKITKMETPKKQKKKRVPTRRELRKLKRKQRIGMVSKVEKIIEMLEAERQEKGNLLPKEVSA